MAIFNFKIVLFFTLCHGIEGFPEYDLTQSESVDVTIRDLDAEGTTHGGRAALVDLLKVTLHRREENISLVLERNRNIRTDIPVSVYRNGNFIYQDVNDTEAVGFYYSLEPFATVMATTNSSSSSKIVKLTGDIKLQNKTYRLHYHEGARGYRLAALADRMYTNDDDVIRSESSRLNLTDRLLTEFVSEEERITKRLYEVEVLAVADYTEYQFWFKLASETVGTSSQISCDLAAKQKLRQYMAFVLNGVDLRYRSITTRSYNIRVSLSALYIADTRESSPWTENNKRNLTDPVQVDSDTVLDDFTQWCNDNKERLPGHDHAMLFTKYDITRTENEVLDRDNVGLAHLGDICQERKQSLIEDDFGEDVSLIAAHELGHSLGAEHDGIHYFCLETERYIMSPEITHDRPLTRNHWKFSACSQYYFNKTFMELNSLGINCMTTRDSLVDYLPDCNNKLPGQIYSPDEQCEYRYGKGSYLLRSAYKLNYTAICSAMKCTDPEDLGYHYVTDAMEGTPCGRAKLCRSGYCVEDKMADKSITDECPFGDSPEFRHGSGISCPSILYPLFENVYGSCEVNVFSCCGTCLHWQPKPALPQVVQFIEGRQPYIGECITSCDGVKNGEYQSCSGCHVYASCFGNILYDERPCQSGLVWSDDFKRCEYTSNTCRK